MMDAATTLRQIGEALYGPNWQAPLADALGVGKRTVQRWAAGSAPVPADLWPRLCDLLAARSIQIDELSRHLAGEDSAPMNRSGQRPRKGG